ncbi:hypothetical protein BDV28DRAFT_100329 [Aspergillus coremiiformis]|uniref:Uncharacterized protein n=1 Tax=Aspergillus coremiiformis TaxID=138285 RepID=A0A5N6YT25_9EURO|nr:hypothetical protein BDV28DRAFT_100329 [Aspergillus coremiiformis]
MHHDHELTSSSTALLAGLLYFYSCIELVWTKTKRMGIKLPGSDWLSCLRGVLIRDSGFHAGFAFFLFFYSIYFFFIFLSLLCVYSPAFHQALEVFCILTSIPSENILMASW